MDPGDRVEFIDDKQPDSHADHGDLLHAYRNHHGDGVQQIKQCMRNG